MPPTAPPPRPLSAAAAPTAAVGISVLGAVVAAIGIADAVAPMTVAILMLLPLSAFEATTALPAAAVQLTRSRIAARRLRDLTEPDSNMRTRPPVTPVALEPGARLAVTGPSGSGKTTLLMAMAENPAKAAFFAEDAHLFATTVRDNLLVARGDATDEELRNALRRVGLGDWLDALPNGLSTVLVGGAAAVSAGQRRRLLLARALDLDGADRAARRTDRAPRRRRRRPKLLTELLTPGALFPAERTVVVATHHLPDDVVCPRTQSQRPASSLTGMSEPPPPPPHYGAYPGGYPPPPPQPYSGFTPPPTGPSNGLGIAALVIAIVGLVFCWTVAGGVILGVSAVIIGFVARGRVKRGEATNGGVAIAGIVLGFLAIIVVAHLHSDLDRGLRRGRRDGLRRLPVQGRVRQPGHPEVRRPVPRPRRKPVLRHDHAARPNYTPRRLGMNSSDSSTINSGSTCVSDAMT